MKRKLVIVTALLLMLTGCATANKSETSPSNNNNGSMKAQSVKQHSAESNHNDNIAHLEELAKGVNGVNNAHVVIIGNTAIVGIDVDADLERSRVGTIKYSVAEAFRHDPIGVNAIVTADIDLRERVKEIRKDVTAGRPIIGIAEELSDIVGRIVPQIPTDLMPAQKENQYKAASKKKLYETPDEMVKDAERNLKGK